MEQEQKIMLWRMAGAAALLALCVFTPIPDQLRLFAFLAPYLIIGYDVLWKALRQIGHGQLFDEHFLMALATVGAFAIGEYPEAVFVMLFYQVGEFCQDYAVDKSRASIADLMDIRPDYANLEKNGVVTRVDPEEISVGEIIIVKPGERIPLDGTVLSGSTAIDAAALTGESLPRDVAPGDPVISGCVNLTGLIKITVTKNAGQSTVTKILELVERTSSKKAKAEHFITKFARVYTPIVVLLAVLLAVIPPLLGFLDWQGSVYRALSFLVVSCPCALVISVPLSFFGGIGGAGRAGILVKGGNYLEALAKVDTVVFDKTGTLTHGKFAVAAICPESLTDDQLLELAALAESYSNHPIAASLRSAYDRELDPSRVAGVKELPGQGLTAAVDGKTVACGNPKLMAAVGADCRPCEKAVGTAIHVAVDGVYAGHIIVADSPKADAKEAVSALKALGVKRTVMLTGDAKAVGESVARDLGLDQAHTELLPAQKVEEVEKLLARKSGLLAFVGDGVNDAPVLARADVGVAMGALGSDAAIEAADVVLMDDKPSKLALAVKLARRTLSIVKQNIIFALAVKVLVLVLIALGWVNMWAAVFADVGVSVLAVLNAMRALSPAD